MAKSSVGTGAGFSSPAIVHPEALEEILVQPVRSLVTAAHAGEAHAERPLRLGPAPHDHSPGGRASHDAGEEAHEDSEPEHQVTCPFVMNPCHSPGYWPPQVTSTDG